MTTKYKKTLKYKLCKVVSKKKKRNTFVHGRNNLFFIISNDQIKRSN